VSAPRPKSTIAEIEPYRAGRASAPGFQNPIKLSANENPLGCSEHALAAYRQAESSLHLYPDPRASALRAALGAKHGLDPDRIVFGAGSDEVFALVCQAFLSPGENMVQPQFAFAAWAIAARAAGAAVKSAPERDYTVDVDAMLAEVDAATRVVFVANPANPTGGYIPGSEIERLHAGLPEHVLLVLDGAYAEFAPGGGAGDWRLCADRPNILVTRTFSKLHGLASLRIGWGYGAPEVIDALNRIRLPFNVPAAGQAAALGALKDDDFVARSIAAAEHGRERLARLFFGYGWRALPSRANFVTVEAPNALAARELESRLAERGILVRGLSNYGMPSCLRVSAGRADQLDALEQALEALLR
jgi:histidinol-phosphate aminotransferase